jgi:hypothetical protein
MPAGFPLETPSLTVVIAPDAPPLEERVATLLSNKIRMERRSPDVQVSIIRAEAAPTNGSLPIFLGRAGTAQMDSLCKKYNVTLPGKQRVAPESFALKFIGRDDGGYGLVAVGADGRGVLYAAGEILRQASFKRGGVTFSRLDLQSAPAYRFRGSSANQGGTMMQITGARSWTEDERHDYILELALSGANTFYASGTEFDFVKQYDLMTVTDCRPNEYRGSFPKEWQATERGGWVCPSVPEARKALLEQWDKDFAQRPDHDVLRMYAGDPGGCRCPRCEPWGKTFVLLCEEVANLWLKHHPHSIVQIANQDLSNAGDQAIFDYLNEKPRTWLEGLAYGPGSNAMSPYFRNELREDLFEYPRTGPVSRYLAETLNQLPKYQQITHYSDITHWISAQYQVEHPEPNIVKVYGRRTFHTRPQAFYDINQAIMPFSEGDIIYSEGYHDELHQWMWNRLLWNPHQSLDAVLGDYFTYFMGPESVESMRAAALQLEKNLETPLAMNDGIDRFRELVKQGGQGMPDFDHLRPGDHRWLEYLQKADLDKYFQLKLRIELSKRQRISDALAASTDSDAKLAAVKAVLAEPAESPEMAALREDARVAGEASNKLYGVRNVGYFSTDKALTDLAWIAKQVDLAAAAPADQRGALLANLVGYEDPGPGGFYDDAGDKDRQPHLVQGESYNATPMMDPNNRPSQNTIAYSLEDPKGVVSFHYTGLEPNAQYRMRATLVLPRLPRGMAQMPEGLKRTETILADGAEIAKDIEVPEYTAQQFEYDIPQSATQDGTLDLTFQRGTGAMAVVVSEVWLLKK